MACGYLGMKVAVYSNVHTTISAQLPGWMHCYNTPFMLVFLQVSEEEAKLSSSQHITPKYKDTWDELQMRP